MASVTSFSLSGSVSSGYRVSTANGLRASTSSAVDGGDHPATERPVATAATRAGGWSGFFARPDSLAADAHQRAANSRGDRSIERRPCAGYHHTDEGPHSAEPDRVLGAFANRAKAQAISRMPTTPRSRRS